MKKSKYIFSALLLCALTAFFMLFPTAVESYKNSKNARGQILEPPLIQSAQNYTAAQIFDIISQSLETPNTTRIESSKTESEYIKDCGEIFDSVYANAGDFPDDARKQFEESKTKKFTAYKFMSIYNSELAWINFYVCEFDGVTVCYEEQNLLPLFILFDPSSASDNFSKYLIDGDTIQLLNKLLQNYYYDLDITVYEFASGEYENFKDTGENFVLFEGFDFMTIFCDNLMSATIFEQDVTQRHSVTEN